jgi:fructose-bisphosphate aldolase, class II
MTLVPLAEVLQPAQRDGYAVAGLVCLGWEDMRAFVRAAEAEQLPVILQTGPGCRAHTPLPVLARMLRTVGESASVPVVAHLDHAYSLEECAQAIAEGYTSVMYDGSGKPLQQNIDQTAAIVERAHAAGVSCEGEIGFVGYDAGAASIGTDPKEAQRFAHETGVDAMAISVGNVHLQQGHGVLLDETRIRHIQALTSVPLVIHGGSGVPYAQRAALARQSNICKFNFGTELRQVFGLTLREVLREKPDSFDRIEILGGTEAAMQAAAQKLLRMIGPNVGGR